MPSGSHEGPAGPVRHGAQTRHEIPFALFPPKLAGDLEAHGSAPCAPARHIDMQVEHHLVVLRFQLTEE